MGSRTDILTDEEWEYLFSVFREHSGQLEKAFNELSQSINTAISGDGFKMVVMDDISPEEFKEQHLQQPKPQKVDKRPYYRKFEKRRRR